MDPGRGSGPPHGVFGAPPPRAGPEDLLSPRGGGCVSLGPLTHLKVRRRGCPRAGAGARGPLSTGLAAGLAEPTGQGGVAPGHRPRKTHFLHSPLFTETSRVAMTPALGLNRVLVTLPRKSPSKGPAHGLGAKDTTRGPGGRCVRGQLAKANTQRAQGRETGAPLPGRAWPRERQGPRGTLAWAESAQTRVPSHTLWGAPAHSQEQGRRVRSALSSE